MVFLPRVAIMGGTFDPIHYGHLVVAEEARHRFSLDKVVFVPAGHPPHKSGEEVSPARDRFLMAVLATVSNPWFEVSDLEVERPGPSYTVDTLREFKGLYGPGSELFFITGADAALEIGTWKDPDTILELCVFLAATRPGYRFPSPDEVSDPALRPYLSRILRFDIPELGISSTDIRARVREGRPIRYLVPESVAAYIAKAGLYRYE